MGSGGGGSGGSEPSGAGPSRPRSRRGGRAGGGGGGSSGTGQCDFNFEVDLSAVDSEVLVTVAVGDALSLGIERRGKFEAVVCRTSNGSIAGTLANIGVLAELLACLHSHVPYRATILALGSGFCTVFVENDV